LKKKFLPSTKPARLSDAARRRKGEHDLAHKTRSRSGPKPNFDFESGRKISGKLGHKQKARGIND